MNRLLYAFIWAIIFSAIGIISLIVIWLYFPSNPVDFAPGKQKVLTKTVKQGNHVVYIASFCKHSSVIPTIQKSFIDGFIYATPPVIGIEMTEGCHSLTVRLYVPQSLPVGRYKIHSVYRYQVNPIRTVDKVTETEDFYVIN